MKKQEYINSLVAANTDGKTQKLYSDVIDCVDIALSQESDEFEVKNIIGLKELYEIIALKGRNSTSKSVGPFEVAEMFAEKFGAKYTRASRRFQSSAVKLVTLEEFL